MGAAGSTEVREEQRVDSPCSPAAGTSSSRRRSAHRPASPRTWRRGGQSRRPREAFAWLPPAAAAVAPARAPRPAAARGAGQPARQPPGEPERGDHVGQQKQAPAPAASRHEVGLARHVQPLDGDGGGPVGGVSVVSAPMTLRAMRGPRRRRARGAEVGADRAPRPGRRRRRRAACRRIARAEAVQHRSGSQTMPSRSSASGVAGRVETARRSSICTKRPDSGRVDHSALAVTWNRTTCPAPGASASPAACHR
jgi:hypothetical protein